MKVLFVNNEGGGFAEELEVKKSTTIGQFFTAQMGKKCKVKDCLIRVNRKIVPESYIIQEGDRITMTPTKVDGS